MADLTIDQICAVEQRREKMRPLAFAVMLPEIAEAARACGYAIAVHGSLTRDCDLLAAPWTDEAVPAEDLILALCVAVDALGRTAPEQKPHGRIAWSLHVGHGMYFDVSVMPRGTPMPDLPIYPDLTSAEPRCSAECPSFVPRETNPKWGECSIDESDHGPEGCSMCHVYLLASHAELVQLRARVAEIERKRARCAWAAKNWRWQSLTWRATVRQHHEQRCDRCRRRGADGWPDPCIQMGPGESCSRFEAREKDHA